MSKEKLSTYLVHKHMGSSALGWAKLNSLGLLMPLPYDMVDPLGTVWSVMDGLTQNGSSPCFIFQHASRGLFRW